MGTNSSGRIEVRSILCVNTGALDAVSCKEWVPIVGKGMFMDRETYEFASQGFKQAVDLDAVAQREFLENLVREDEAVAEQVLQMLEADALASQSRFFEPPVRLAETRPTLHPSEASNGSDRIVGSKIDEYLLEERIGQGGMGVVYRARDLMNQRHVAIKLIRIGPFVKEELILRFRSERVAAATMDHPNIVPVYASGRGAGFEYYTMALLGGGTLKDLLSLGLPDQRRVAGYFVKIARAIEYAHQKGIIHRDIKPANILFTNDSEPMIADFGVAKLLNSAEGYTATGQVMGTMVYMAPEQFESSRDVLPASDVYGLGATLYECLTGQKVFESDLLNSFYDSVRNRLPHPPADINSEIDTELSDICMKCLAKAASDRYSSAKDLADDLERYLAGEPLSFAGDSEWNTFSKVISFRESHESLISQGATGWILVSSMVVHPMIFLIVWMELSVPALWVVLLVWMLTAVVMSVRFHWRQYWQLSSMERQSGWILAGVNLALVFLFLIHGPLTVNASTSKFLAVYPPLSLIVGVAMFAHAGIHSGRWLLVGSLFFPLAIVVSWLPIYAPLLFCAAGVAASVVVHRDVRLSS